MVILVFPKLIWVTKGMQLTKIIMGILWGPNNPGEKQEREGTNTSIEEMKALLIFLLGNKKLPQGDVCYDIIYRASKGVTVVTTDQGSSDNKVLHWIELIKKEHLKNIT